MYGERQHSGLLCAADQNNPVQQISHRVQLLSLQPTKPNIFPIAIAGLIQAVFTVCVLVLFIPVYYNFYIAFLWQVRHGCPCNTFTA